MWGRARRGTKVLLSAERVKRGHEKGEGAAGEGGRGRSGEVRGGKFK